MYKNDTRILCWGKFFLSMQYQKFLFVLIEQGYIIIYFLFFTKNFFLVISYFTSTKYVKCYALCNQSNLKTKIEKEKKEKKEKKETRFEILFPNLVYVCYIIKFKFNWLVSLKKKKPIGSLLLCCFLHFPPPCLYIYIYIYIYNF